MEFNRKIVFHAILEKLDRRFDHAFPFDSFGRLARIFGRKPFD